MYGSGPGFRVSDFESNRIIAQYQVDGAKKLMSEKLSPVSGPVKWVHAYLNMYFVTYVPSTLTELSIQSHEGLSDRSLYRMERPCKHALRL